MKNKPKLKINFTFPYIWVSLLLCIIGIIVGIVDTPKLSEQYEYVITTDGSGNLKYLYCTHITRHYSSENKNYSNKYYVYTTDGEYFDGFQWQIEAHWEIKFKSIKEFKCAPLSASSWIPHIILVAPILIGIVIQLLIPVSKLINIILKKISKFIIYTCTLDLSKKENKDEI